MLAADEAAVVAVVDAEAAVAADVVAPGVYKITMTANGKSYSNTIVLRPDPILTAQK